MKEVIKMNIPSWINLIPKDMRKSELSLESIGVNDVAWSRKDAISIAWYIHNNNYAILGGDVLVIKNNKISYTYDNWSIDKKINSNMIWQEIIDISLKITTQYILKYNEGNNNIYYSYTCVNNDEYNKLLST
jgi:immunity protein 40 of polymorphic toxin system